METVNSDFTILLIMWCHSIKPILKPASMVTIEHGWLSFIIVGAVSVSGLLLCGRDLLRKCTVSNILETFLFYFVLYKNFIKIYHSSIAWNNIVTIAAVDCANSDNLHLCRDYDINVFPTLKFFSANAQPSNRGLVVKKSNDETSLAEGLIDILEKEQLEGKGANWPNLVPIR